MLMWVPGHSGIEDNKLADKAAKDEMSLRYSGP